MTYNANYKSNVRDTSFMGASSAHPKTSTY